MDSKKAIAALAALAQETRLDVFRLLVRAGPGGLTAGAISQRLSVPGATMSFHLKELKNARVVHCRRETRSLIYSPDFAVMNALIEFLTEHCCEETSCRACPDPINPVQPQGGTNAPATGSQR